MSAQITCVLIGIAIGLLMGAVGSFAAYRNGVVDGARNQWIPRVAHILNKEK